MILLIVLSLKNLGKKNYTDLLMGKDCLKNMQNFKIHFPDLFPEKLVTS